MLLGSGKVVQEKIVEGPVCLLKRYRKWNYAPRSVRYLLPVQQASEKYSFGGIVSCHPQVTRE